MSGSDHTAAENSIEGTGGFGLSARPGISFVGVEGGLARGNEVSDTVQAGIVVSGGHDIDVIGNDVRDSELSNISVQGGAMATLVEKNETRGGFFGINADDNALAVIRKNTALKAINDGIHNGEATNPVFGNTANRNGDYGIDSASGDLSHDNVAKNNTNPAQCTPAVGLQLEAEDERKRLVHGAKLRRSEPPGASAQTLRVNDRRLLDQDACLLAIQLDAGPKGRRPRARGRWRDEDRAQAEKLVGLHDDGVPAPALLVPLRSLGRRQLEELASDHLSPRRRGRARSSAREQPPSRRDPRNRRRGLVPLPSEKRETACWPRPLRGPGGLPASPSSPRP